LPRGLQHGVRFLARAAQDSVRALLHEIAAFGYCGVGLFTLVAQAVVGLLALDG
jgi:hypothetical protein